MGYFRTFGNVAHFKIVGPDMTRLEERSCLGTFLGYKPGTMGYWVYEPISKCMHITHDMWFEEER